MTKHQTVLLHEAVNALNIKDGAVFIDGTFGRGGHSALILEHLNENGRLLAIDKDITAVEWAQIKFANDNRFSMHHASFADISSIAEQNKLVGKVDGILLDLGVSSPQLDEAERGFSFLKDGPLDMRMDVGNPVSAEVFVNTASIDEMRHIFKLYGEERFALRIARAIEKARAVKPITRTLELAEIVKAANPKWEKHKHPATRVFQAIRIHINGELEELQQFLQQSLDLLKIGGRLVIISFHSLEDRIVKTFMRNAARGKQLPVNIPIQASDLGIRLKIIGKLIKPSDEEIRANNRARSAVLRIGEKIL